MADSIRVLFISDIVGTPGIQILDTLLASLLQKHKPNFVVANGENSHEGMGINEEIVKHLYSIGVNVITGGNHSFDKWKILPYMKSDKNLLRPLNYPKGVNGYGYGIYDVPGKNIKIAVLNLQGRTFLPSIDDPFRTADWALDRIKEETSLIFVDFHAEATAEKVAMGWYLDGKASVMVGTHTHIPTNDARIMPRGMGYITDAGMTGSFNSVIGMDKDTALRRFMLSTPQKYQSANGDNRICGVIADIDIEKATCVHIEPLIYPSFPTSK
ncbi:MAG: TIGR00282 family metallophosphoesterase [Bacteroidetes bacterium]|nr:TIGR00282 family metallophosphoesterase [Bacteroidota bacterium]MCH8523237.1 TIGR00282 family metallophosphoesterase [Balneolales bacterium]